jgi:hypothetical protein
LLLENPDFLVRNRNLLVGTHDLLVENPNFLVGNLNLLVGNHDLLGENPNSWSEIVSRKLKFVGMKSIWSQMIIWCLDSEIDS